MERESNPMEALCRSGCGFYGNPATDGLCSVCFKEALKKKQQPPASTPSPVSAAPFVPAPTQIAPATLAPTPLAAAAPTVVCLPHADIMDENNGKDGKEENNIQGRKVKKGKRRNSKDASVDSDKTKEVKFEDVKAEAAATDADRDRPGPSQPRNTSLKNLKRKCADDEESGAGADGAAGASSASDADADADIDGDDKDPSKDKKKKNRCAICRKKVGLTGFECRCGGLFCAVHRYSDKHDCSFDYRELGAQEIRRNNPVVVSQKIHKI